MANGLSPETLEMLRQRGMLAPNGLASVQPQASLPPLDPNAAQPPPAAPEAPGLLANLWNKIKNPSLGAYAPLTPEQTDAAQARASQLGQSDPGRVTPGVYGRPKEQENGPQQPSGPVDAVFAAPPGGAAPGAAAMQGGPAPTVIPAHEGRAVSPQTEAMLTAAQGEKAAAANQGEAAEVGANEAHAKALAVIGGQADADRIQSQTREGRAQAAMNEQQRDYDAMAKEAAAARPDYGRFMRSKGALGQVTAAIASGLSAAGGALSHTGGNGAMDIINASIDRDVAQQRDELANKRAGVQEKAKGLAQMRERYGDERQADMAERAKQLEIYKLKGDQIATEANSPVIAARWASTRAALDEQQGQLHQAMHPWQQAQAVGGAGGAGIGAGVSDVKPEEVLRLNDGRYVAIADAAARAKATEFTSKADQVHQGAQDIQRLLQMPFAARAAHPFEWQRQFHAAKEQLAMAEMLGGGKGGIGATKANIEAIGDGNFLWHPGVQKTVAILDQNAQRLAQEHIAHSGGRIVEPTMVPNAKKGEIERRFLDRGQIQMAPQGTGAPAYTIRPPGG